MTGSRQGSGTGGTLYVVATPIGNLGDITLRALEVLASVPLIAAEDTRHTRRLLDHHAITTRMTSYHAQSDAGRTAGPARASARRRRPRARHRCRDARRSATRAASWWPPGPAEGGDGRAGAGRIGAVLAAVAGPGVAGPRWAFEGFLPRSGRERRERLARIAADDRGTILYEAPTRVAATLRDLADGMRRGPARRRSAAS